MGRLDDAAKRKVVELRKAGLSFRKIKAVLELDNIKVSAQAIYLFLREFQGRAPGRVRPEDAAGGTVPPQVLAGGRREGWSNIQLQNLLREASHHVGLSTEFAKQNSTALEVGTQPSGSGEASGGGRPETQQKGNNKDENDIQIISVTSLAQHRQQSGIQSTGAGVGPTAVTSSGATMSGATMSGATMSGATMSAAFMRRRVTPSPATNPILAARKRLLDKALSHRTKSFQQVASLLRRDQSSVPGADLRGAMPRQPETYDLTTETTTMEGQPGGPSGPRRFLQMRPGPAVRSPHPPPRVGVRLPNRAPPPLTSQAPGGGAVIRLQNPGAGQGPMRRDGNHPGPQQTGGGGGGGGGGGLQEHIQALGSEVHSLGLSVRMLVQQQCRLEREQTQQTQVQRQILSTLQGLASRLGSCSALQRAHDKTPPPPAPSSSLPSASSSATPSGIVNASSFGQQSGFAYGQGAYSQCSQAQQPQPSYGSLDGLDGVEAFKLPGLSPTPGGVNGFQSCGNNNSGESLPLTHAPTAVATHVPPYAPPSYTQQQHGQANNMASYAQPFAHPAYSQPHSQPYRGTESKAPDYPGGCSTQDCSVSTQPDPEDPQLNIIKVEGP